MIVGLTGGIASGKTFCTDYLRAQYNTHIVDADIIAREVVAIGSDGLEEIKDFFGLSVINQDGSLNRKKMREIIISNNHAREKLNSITHPRIRLRILEKLNPNDKKGYQILCAPLLLENGLQSYTQAVVVIDVNIQTQLSRIQQRDNVGVIEAQKILSTQFSRQSRLYQTHFIIDNSQTKVLTHRSLDILHNKLEKLSELYF